MEKSVAKREELKVAAANSGVHVENAVRKRSTHLFGRSCTWFRSLGRRHQRSCGGEDAAVTCRGQCVKWVQTYRACVISDGTLKDKSRTSKKDASWILRENTRRPGRNHAT